MKKVVAQYDKKAKKFTQEVVEYTHDEIEAHYKILLEHKLESFREYRNQVFNKFDILKTNIAVGLEPPLTQVEIDWYNAMKDFPALITKDTTRNNYPIIPHRISMY